jgi:hypothetical protein
MCPHCLLEGIVTFIVVMPVLGFCLKWIKSKLRYTCDCNKDHK